MTSQEKKRDFLPVANWKMHKTLEEGKSFAQQLLKQGNPYLDSMKVVLAAPFTLLSELGALLQDSRAYLSAQNVHFEEKGAFTGEISVDMLSDVGCQYCIIGHSERRELFHETDEWIAKKAQALIKKKITPILCVGETEKERKENLTEKKVTSQLQKALSYIEETENTPLVLAYEPIWAIGTGQTATPQMAQEVHGLLRSHLAKLRGNQFAEMTPILYGGSVKPENALELSVQKDIDGLLIGGASLEINSFLQILEASNRAILSKS